MYVHHPIHSPLGQEPDCEFYPAKIASQAPWFGPHLQRDVYLSLQHMRSEGGTVPETVLRAALLRRATENINRVDKLRNAKTACGTLLQRGSVGEELFIRLQQTEKEMEEEIRDTVMEVSLPAHSKFFFFFSLFFLFAFPSGIQLKPCFTLRLGQRLGTAMGQFHLPVRERNRRQHDIPKQNWRDPSSGGEREGMVGKAADH